MSNTGWILVCLMWMTSSIEGFRFTQRVFRLSTAKRELGGAVIDGVAYFGGGCTDTQSPWVCDDPTNVIDVIHLSKNITYMADAHLSTARGWASTCTTGSKIVFAGGGTSGTEAHTTVADVLDIKTGKVSSYPTALSVGRWGLGCATTNGTIHYGGGKVCLGNRCSKFYDTDSIDTVTFNSAGTAKWQLSKIKLSHGRESIGTVVDDDGRLIFGGGWDGSKSTGVVDIIDSNGKVSTSQLNLQMYWVGVASVNGGIYLVGNDYLYVLHKSSTSWVSESLPSDMRGGIPNARLPQNGHGIGTLACFYTSKPSASVVCYDTVKKQWGEPMKCSASHTAGAIVGTSNSILVAGGIADGSVKPTDIVDVFDIKSE